MQIIEGIYQLLTPFPQFTIEAAKEIRGTIQASPRVIKGLPYVLPYMIRDGGDTVLVDCGWNTDSAYQSLEEGMKEHNSHPTEVQKLVITHVHPDHYGMAGRLKQLSSCEVVVHEEDAKVITSRYFAPKGLIDEMSKFMEKNGVPNANSPEMSRGSMGMLMNVAPVPADTEVKGGESFKVGDFDFEIIWTPGHSPGHVVLNVDSGGAKGVFIGDVIHHPMQILFPHLSCRADFDMDASRTSRTALIEKHADSGAIILPQHFASPSCGRIKRAGSRFAFDFISGS